jgi:hypothetical protein
VQTLLPGPSQYQQLLNILCDCVRDDLALADPTRFPRYGQHPIAVMEVLIAIFNFTSFGQPICVTCGSPRLSHSGPLHHDAVRSTLQIEPHVVPTGSRPTVSFDDPLSGSIVSPNVHSPSCHPHHHMHLANNYRNNRSCCVSPTHRHFFFVNVADWDMQTNPNHSLTLVMVDGTPKIYRLCAAICHGGIHWTSRWIASNGHVWKHRGGLELDGKMIEPCGRSKIARFAVMACGHLLFFFPLSILRTPSFAMVLI